MAWRVYFYPIVRHHSKCCLRCGRDSEYPAGRHIWRRTTIICTVAAENCHRYFCHATNTSR